ncbi:hypothetical protein K0B04_03340 [Patescibacteria group bacterium]|nr:hypothetical protein [Patescibacteria group bacterium]
MEEKIEEKVEESKSEEENVGMAVVAYFLFFVPLLTDSKDDPFVKFHVKQSLLIFCSGVALNVLWFVLPISRFFWFIYQLAYVGLLVLFVIGVMNAINKQEKELPYIGKYADKFFKF